MKRRSQKIKMIFIDPPPPKTEDERRDRERRIEQAFDILFNVVLRRYPKSQSRFGKSSD
ncbi:MAG: hypothetical protein UY29_C0001G0026 [Parcubacteria group bacterium GW2011_GWC2_48_17]|nr:MAG: hypothetical protein UY29_C0001G0026 [Parcubacteria group bacterium GW2011_GWC2_48_17]